jgi:hypothetical protein
MTDDRGKAAEEIRAIARIFGIAGAAVVTFQKKGRYPVRLPLNELLNRLDDPPPERQTKLFDATAISRNGFDPD